MIHQLINSYNLIPFQRPHAFFDKIFFYLAIESRLSFFKITSDLQLRDKQAYYQRIFEFFDSITTYSLLLLSIPSVGMHNFIPPF